MLDIPAEVAHFLARIGATEVSLTPNGGLLVQQWTLVFTTPGNGEQPARLRAMKSLDPK